jgi:hypothetical protein
MKQETFVRWLDRSYCRVLRDYPKSPYDIRQGSTTLDDIDLMNYADQAPLLPFPLPFSDVVKPDSLFAECRE